MILKKERQRRKAGEAAPELMQEGAKVFREPFFSGTAGPILSYGPRGCFDIMNFDALILTFKFLNTVMTLFGILMLCYQW